MASAAGGQDPSYLILDEDGRGRIMGTLSANGSAKAVRQAWEPAKQAGGDVVFTVVGTDPPTGRQSRGGLTASRQSVARSLPASRYSGNQSSTRGDTASRGSVRSAVVGVSAQSRTAKSASAASLRRSVASTGQRASAHHMRPAISSVKLPERNARRSSRPRSAMSTGRRSVSSGVSRDSPRGHSGSSPSMGRTMGRTRRNPKARIPNREPDWNSSTSYHRPHSMLWAMTVGHDDLPERQIATAMADGNENRARALATGESDTMRRLRQRKERLAKAESERRERQAAPRDDYAGDSYVESPRSRPQSARARSRRDGLDAGTRSLDTTPQRRRPQSARPSGRPSVTAEGSARISVKHDSILAQLETGLHRTKGGEATVRGLRKASRPSTRTTAVRLNTEERLGARNYSAAYAVGKEYEADALMFDFPDPPRRYTEEAACRLIPYSNYKERPPRRATATWGVTGTR